MISNLKKILMFSCIISLVLPVIPTCSSSKELLSPIKNSDSSPENFSVDIIELMQQVNESKLRKHIQTIQDFGPHNTGSEALTLVGNYIYNELNVNNLQVEYMDWKEKEFSGKNVVATLNGMGQSNGIIILCAHYDSIRISPGAEDDGSGVAVVLMLAEIMSNRSFNSTIKFILFSGEEQGILGSKAYAQDAKKNGDNIVGVLCLDKVGYAQTTDEGNKVFHNSNEKSAWMVDISTEMAKQFYDYVKLDVIAKPQDPFSDHLSFVKEGFCGTDFVRYAKNPFYHTSEDNIEKINFTYLSKICNLTLATVFTVSRLNPVLTSNDLKIKIKGSFLSKPSSIYVKVENNGSAKDTANVSIDISMKHVVLKNDYFFIKKKHDYTTCHWFLTKEIENYWEFFFGYHTYTRGLCRFTIVIKGINDDIYLYKKVVTFGWIIKNDKVRLVPQL